MKINQRLELRLKLSLNLLLKQQLELLTLQAQELEHYINEELLRNPLIKGVFRRIPKRFEVKETSTPEIPLSEGELSELERNIRIEMSEEEALIALELLRFCDERGFLRESPRELSSLLRVEEERIEEVRRKLMRLEPLGVGSRDVWEFLELQIDEVYPEESERLKGYLRSIQNGSRSIPQDVKEKLSRLTLSPLSPQEGGYRLAKVDAVIEEEEGKLVFYLYDDFIDVDLNEEYLELYRKHSGKLRGFLREAFERYEAIRKALQIRKENLRKILKIVVERQGEFLMGRGNLRTLTLKEVARELGVHESTVSRIVNSKYVKTPVGTYPLKFFFVRQSAGGVSQDELLSLVEKIIREEDPARPLSDEQIARTLKEMGYEVARRTVTKYREMLGIPPSRERRKSA
ncbi:MAG: RNA polymerase factor sigma-54 [Aquificae bacterium]|nr:RNA polymerase factor sigma-54 [Aquificota bacterium]